LDSKETVRIYNDKTTVARMYADSSIVIDDKDNAVRSFNNK